MPYINGKQCESRVLFDAGQGKLVLLRRVSPGAPEAQVDCGSVSALLMARDVGELIEAADALGPMDRGRDALTAEEAVDELADAVPPTQRQLMHALFGSGTAVAGEFDGFGYPVFKDASSPRRAAARRCAAERGGVDRDFFCEGACFYYETVADWEALRNLFSAAMRVLVKATEPTANVLLTGAGFAAGEGKRGGRERLMIPVSNDRVAVPGPISRRLDAQKSAFFVGERVGLCHGKDGEGTYLYLDVDTSRPPRSMGESLGACVLMNTMDLAFSARRRIEVAAAERGRELAEVAEPVDLPSAMWEILRDHPGQRILVCERCRRVRYVSSGGREARWCCDSCRVLAQKENK